MESKTTISHQKSFFSCSPSRDRIQKNILALLAGGLLAFAFAPFGFYLLAMFAPALLLATWLHATPWEAFRRGLLFGLGLFGVGTSWIFVSIHEFGNTNVFLAGFITALFVTILALFPAFFGYLLTRFFPANTAYKLCLAFPSGWVIFEWIRSWFFTGFPWLFLGASQINSPLRGLAPIVGEYGLSFIVAFCSGLFILAFQFLYADKKWKIILPCLTILVIVLISNLFTKIQWTHAENNPITVSLVQGNIPQQIKWDPDYLKMTLDRYSQLSQNQWQNQIVVWPEAAIPWLLQDANDFLTSLDKTAKQNHSVFITGIPIKDGFDYYNGVIARGIGQGIYYKRHLVPFGEYVPLDSWLRGLIGFFDIPMSNFSAGPAKQPNLKIPGLEIAPFVCYEIAYPELVYSTLPQANLLLTVSNDAWFGHSFASTQHLQIAQMRALETGRYLLFSNNTGVSAIINPQGIIEAASPAFQATVLNGTILKMTGITPIAWLGIMPILVFISALLGVAGWLEWRRVLSKELMECTQ